MDPRSNFFSKKFEAISDYQARQSKTRVANLASGYGCKHIDEKLNKTYKTDKLEDKDEEDKDPKCKKIQHPVWCNICDRFTASLNIKLKHIQCLEC